MGQRRVFVAVDIPAEARRAAAAYIDELRTRCRDVRIGWERPEKLHFTLKFLGHVQEARIPEIERAISYVAMKYRPFDAEVLGTGVFPNASEPRVLWLGIGKGFDQMAELGTDVENALGDLGFVKETRRFTPHLTIGRVRELRKGRELASAHLEMRFEPVEFKIDHLTIYESTLGDHGSSYDVIARMELGAP